jgi:8-oxo-dGTP diphosphatase
MALGLFLLCDMSTVPQQNDAREYPNQPRIGVGALIFRDDHILLVQRGHEPNKGKWTIPGGLVELGESLEQAVHRELLEECGITARLLDRLNVFEYIQHDDNARVKYHYIIVDYLAEYLKGKLQAGSDIDQASWIAIDEVQSFDITDGLKPAIDHALLLRKNLNEHE